MYLNEKCTYYFVINNEVFFLVLNLTKSRKWKSIFWKSELQYSDCNLSQLSSWMYVITCFSINKIQENYDDKVPKVQRKKKNKKKTQFLNGCVYEHNICLFLLSDFYFYFYFNFFFFVFNTRKSFFPSFTITCNRIILFSRMC